MAGRTLPVTCSSIAGFRYAADSISNAQRAPLPSANFAGTVYHGLPLDLHKPRWTSAGGYLAFPGRISPEKRPDRAIAIARAAGVPLKIAAKVDKVDEAYFQEVIAPLLNGTDVDLVGEINERQDRVSRPGDRIAFSHRLARAVRAGHDRGHGLRHAGACLPLRIGPGVRRGRADRAHRFER
jgi:hypothetical protein